MRRFGTAVLMILLFVTPTLPQQAAGQATTVVGNVTVSRAAMPTPAPLKFKDNVFVGDTITTVEQSLAKIVLGGKALVTMRELSALTITGDPILTLDRGKIAYAVSRQRMRPGEVHEIRTANAIARVHGTLVVVEVERPAPVAVTNICVFGGTVFVSVISGPEIQLGGKQCITITGKIPGPVRPVPPIRDPPTTG